MNYSITYVLEKKNDRPGESQLRMRVRWDGKLSQFYIPFPVNPERWSKETNRCTANSSHGKARTSATVINREIQKHEDIAEKIFNLLKNPSKEEFDKRFRLLKEGKDITAKPEPESMRPSVLSVYDNYIEIQGKKKGWTPKYTERNETVKNHLFDFKKDVTFQDLEREDTLNEFIYYLSTPGCELLSEISTFGTSNNKLLFGSARLRNPFVVFL